MTSESIRPTCYDELDVRYNFKTSSSFPNASLRSSFENVNLVRRHKFLTNAKLRAISTPERNTVHYVTCLSGGIKCSFVLMRGNLETVVSALIPLCMQIRRQLSIQTRGHFQCMLVDREKRDYWLKTCGHVAHNSIYI